MIENAGRLSLLLWCTVFDARLGQAGGGRTMVCFRAGWNTPSTGSRPCGHRYEYKRVETGTVLGPAEVGDFKVPRVSVAMSIVHVSTAAPPSATSDKTVGD
ncbi:hypothetical protein BaRGS_00031318 [Batillaria attramentaria]|uniref:Secreted protein n=1 Tax=Batillaria attramentaria TaxID=370345 RepID=A0ABD0JR77_9CAEN